MQRIGHIRAVFFFVLIAPAWVFGADGYRFENVDRVVAVGDIHGALTEFQSLLLKTGLADAEGNWTGGTTHLVSTGDFLDRGDDSRAVMDLLMSLQNQAEEAGGRVHVLLGNHEVMNLTGELDYVSDGEFASYLDLEEPAAPPPESDETSTPAPSLPPGFWGHQRAFAKDGPYGRWLLQRPFLVVINRTAFLHAGLSEELAGQDLDQINDRANADLVALIDARAALIDGGRITANTAFDDAQRAVLALLEDPAADAELKDQAERFKQASTGLPFSAHGPVWYRRTAKCHPYSEQQVTDAILDRLDADRVVIGHTPTQGRTVQSRMGGKVIAIDTGMNVAYYKGNPAALVLEADRTSVIYSALDQTELVTQPTQVWQRPYGMTDQEIEQFLLEAEVTAVVDLATGVTKPQRLDLKRGDQTMRAVFKTYDSDPGLERGRWNKLADKADRYQFDVVAYQLDRILGIDRVPPAVIRTVNGTEGVAQYWMEDTINEKDRRAEDISYTGYCSALAQYNLMNVFDVVIHNDDRNLSNVMYTRRDWTLWLIDHTRAFRSMRGMPDYLKQAEFDINPQIRAALQRIDKDSLKPLEDHLHERQIRGILSRTKALLKKR